MLAVHLQYITDMSDLSLARHVSTVSASSFYCRNWLTYIMLIQCLRAGKPLNGRPNVNKALLGPERCNAIG